MIKPGKSILEALNERWAFLENQGFAPDLVALSDNFADELRQYAEAFATTPPMVEVRKDDLYFRGVYVTTLPATAMIVVAQMRGVDYVSGNTR